MELATGGIAASAIGEKSLLGLMKHAFFIGKPPLSMLFGTMKAMSANMLVVNVGFEIGVTIQAAVSEIQLIGSTKTVGDYWSNW